MHTFVFGSWSSVGGGGMFILIGYKILHLYSEKDIVVLMSLPEASVYQNC